MDYKNILLMLALLSSFAFSQAINYTTYDNISDLNFTNGTITTLWKFGDNAVGGIASPILLIVATTITLFTVYTPNRAGRSVAASGVVGVILSIVFMGAGLLHPYWIFVTVVYLIIGLYLSSKETSF